METLRGQSSILEFHAKGSPPDAYAVRFHGRGLWLPHGSDRVEIRELHDVRILLGASYPRLMPELHWVSPIFHANISSSGVVCLGGYGTHWVPSLGLDKLCEMLWDMIRYKNFDVDSPYNREAAAWTKTQCTYALPVDERSIRDLVATNPNGPSANLGPNQPMSDRPDARNSVSGTAGGLRDDDEEIIDAELVEPEDQDILFLD
ncbi:MAG: ubiquitin-conjugating enzyme E2 [Planctomycetota bacterium]